MLTWETNSRVHMSVDGGSICELQELTVKEIRDNLQIKSKLKVHGPVILAMVSGNT